MLKTVPEDTGVLRARHRARRAELSVEAQTANAAALTLQVEARPEYQSATTIAAYIAIRGEMNLQLLIEAGSAAGKQFYLPVLDGEAMFFAPWALDRPLVKKGFGLLEPDVEESDYLAPQQLDLVLAPLVVFDQRCNRIGQGGGFYDRTFAHKNPAAGATVPSPPVKPILMGVAHDSQREPALQPESWDVPLDLIVTERSVYLRSG